ncbi:MAG: ATP-binding cassette domain-containing protein [Candidatus Rokubacteria bacterium]|nr:ATP-binding cassette domain-containing protein [Candidatus Rokubacteria bacterium]
MNGNGRAVLQVEQVSRHFGALAALTHVDLEVREGEVFSVIGPNGAGKSTLFNVITGLYPPTGGRVRFRGDEITGRSPAAVNRKGLA